MKSKFVVENLADFLKATGAFPSTEDKGLSVPRLEAKLEVVRASAQHPGGLMLSTDSLIYELSPQFTFKELVIQLAEHAGVQLVGRDAIPVHEPYE